MRWLIISTLASLSLVAAANTVLQSHSPLAAGMPSLRELHSTAGIDKLPIEDFEDMSLVYSTVTTQ